MSAVDHLPWGDGFDADGNLCRSCDGMGYELDEDGQEIECFACDGSGEAHGHMLTELTRLL